MSVIVVRHLEKKSTAITVRRIDVKIFWLPCSLINHEVIAMREPKLLLPCDDLRCPSQRHECRIRKSFRAWLIVIVNFGKPFFVEHSDVGIVPEFKLPFYQTFPAAVAD